MIWAPWVVGLFATWACIDVMTSRVPGWPEAIVGVTLIGALVWAALDLRSGGFVRARRRGSPQTPQVALTFDDGPDPRTTPLILAALARHDAKATFFVLGDKTRAHPELVAQIVAAGHEVGGHGDAHRWRDLVSVGRATASIRRASQSIVDAGAASPKWFRPPYGVSVPALGSAMRRLELTVVGWSLRTFDAGRNATHQDVLERATGIDAGDIVLLHDASEEEGGRVPLGPDVLEEILMMLARRGLKSVTVSEVLRDQT